MALDPELQQTRDYVAAEAARRDTEALIQLVEVETGRFHDAARRAVATRPGTAAPGEEWEPVDIARHLVQRSMLRAREALWVALSGEVPAPEETPLPDDLEGLLRVHREAIDSLYEHVRAATDEFLGVSWEHPSFGPWNWREWMVFISVHTADHADQLARMVEDAN